MDVSSVIRLKKARCGEVYRILKTVIDHTVPTTPSLAVVLEGLDRAYARFEALIETEESTMDDKARGLYKKYEVSRVDGKPVLDCIVLEFTDPRARVGLKAWADALAKDYPQLSKDVFAKIAEYERP
jgi:hypothetical protein